jgi:DNA-binding response OmpR family regulator
MLESTVATGRVLLIEDDRFLRRACETTLSRLGFAVVAAMDGEAGLRIARTDIPDLIVLDLLLPGLEGTEVLRALKSDERTRRVPVLVLSNSGRQHDVDHVIELGAAGFLSKANLSFHELGEQLARLLRLDDV